MAISGLRLLIGIASLAAATAGMKFLATLHGAALRIPMELVAIAGSVVNLYAVRRVRKLRARPASQWRMKPATVKQLRSETRSRSNCFNPIVHATGTLVGGKQTFDVQG